jgi:AraC family ethanolamine operon transcriptional activator
MIADNLLPRAGVAIDSHLVEDVDSIAQAMSDGLRGEYVQLESRSFRGRWTTLRLASMVIQFGSQDSAVVRRVRVPGDRCAFMIPLSVPAAARWNGHAVRPDDVVVCPAGTECLAFDPPSTTFAILSVPFGTPLARTVGVMQTPNAAGPVASACGSDAVALRERLARLRDVVESGHVVTPFEIEVDVMTRLRICLERAAAAPREGARTSARSRIVRRAEDFFRSHVSEGVSVMQLSSVAGVSERSLRNAFYDVYTTSPKRYLKLWQLHQVRHALRSGPNGAATVTDVATCHGFYELGRFAGAYKSLFGETPSETLSRARHQRGIRGAA